MWPPVTSVWTYFYRVLQEDKNFYINVDWLGRSFNYHVRTQNIFRIGSKFMSCLIFMRNIDWTQVRFPSIYFELKNTPLRIACLLNSGTMKQGFKITIVFYFVFFPRVNEIPLSIQRQNLPYPKCILCSPTYKVSQLIHVNVNKLEGNKKAKKLFWRTSFQKQPFRKCFTCHRMPRIHKKKSMDLHIRGTSISCYHAG